MGRVLITSSSDGLGSMAARLLVEDGHAVTLHARNEQLALTPVGRCRPPSAS
jgi:NAD(P)-dependent dehydrogenase (short-subunit alcohol dehydrogenase family)